MALAGVTWTSPSTRSLWETAAVLETVGIHRLESPECVALSQDVLSYEAVVRFGVKEVGHLAGFFDKADRRKLLALYEYRQQAGMCPISIPKSV